MKKSFLVLLAAALLLACVLWVKHYREGAPRRDGFAFDTARVGEITSLRVRYLRDSMQLVRIEGIWFTAGDLYPADTARVRKVLGWLVGTRMHEKVSDAADARSLWDYGLNPEDARTVEWAWGGDTVRLLLGKTSTLDYSFTYWKWADPAKGDAVYRTPGNLAWDVSPRAPDWKTRALWTPFTAAEVRALDVEWRDRTGELRQYKVEKTADTFRITRPFIAPASRGAAETLFEQASLFAADDFGSGADPERFRGSLAEPALTLSIQLKNGTRHTLKAGRISGAYQYTQHPYHPNAVWVFKWRYDYFRKTPEEMKGH